MDRESILSSSHVIIIATGHFCRNLPRVRLVFVAHLRTTRIELELDLVQRGRPSQDSRRVVIRRDENLAARGSGRLFRLFIGMVCAKRGRWLPLPFLCSTSFPFSGRTPNNSDTLTPMNLFLVRRPGIRASASTILTPSSGSLTCERLRTHARLQAYALRRRDYVHLSRITHHVCGLSDPRPQR